MTAYQLIVHAIAEMTARRVIEVSNLAETVEAVSSRRKNAELDSVCDVDHEITNTLQMRGMTPAYIDGLFPESTDIVADVGDILPGLVFEHLTAARIIASRTTNFLMARP